MASPARGVGSVLSAGLLVPEAGCSPGIGTCEMNVCGVKPHGSPVFGCKIGSRLLLVVAELSRLWGQGPVCVTCAPHTVHATQCLPPGRGVVHVLSHLSRVYLSPLVADTSRMPHRLLCEKK